MTKDELGALLAEIATDLETLEHPWRLIGSAALIIAGVDWPACDDVDILTTKAGALALEELWSAQREADFEPDERAPFRSQFSRYHFAQGRVEVMGDLSVRTAKGWEALDPGAVVLHSFAGRQWHAPSLADQARILRTFGRPKDLEKVVAIGL